MPGGQTPATPGLTLEAVLSAVRAEIAPLRDELGRVRNSQEAGKRVNAKRGGIQTETSDPASTNGNTPDPTKIADPVTREWAIQMQREAEARAASEAAAAEKAKADRAANRLQGLIDEFKPARPEKLKKLLVHDLKIGTDGRVYHDDGENLRPVEDVFREYIADDIFRPASVSQGAGTTPGASPTIGKPNPMAATASIADPIDRLARQMELRAQQK